MRLLAYGGLNTSIRRFEDMILLVVYALSWGILATLRYRVDSGIWPYVAVASSPFLALAWGWRINRRLKDAGLSRWYAILLFGGPLVLLLILVQFKILGGPPAFVLFVLTQTPITFLRRKVASGPGPTDPK